MTQISRRRIRLKADIASRPGRDKANDVLTTGTPESWRGNDIQIEIGLFNSNTILSDLSNIASLTVDVKDPDDLTGAAVATKTLTNAELSACTSDNWTDGTAQHALVVLPRAQTNFDLGGATKKAFWLVVAIETNDSPGHDVTIQHTIWTIYEDGTGTTDTPPGDINTYYPANVADARYQQQHADGASIAFKNGQHLYIYSTDTAKWHPLTLTQVDGSVVLSVGQTGEDSV